MRRRLFVQSATMLIAVALAALVLLAAPPIAAEGDDDYRIGARVKPTAELDVLVTGVEDPIVGESIRGAIAAWQAGIDLFAADWLRENLTMRVYFPAHDPVPPPGFEPHGLEILFAPQGFFALSGSSGPCVATAPLGNEYLSYGPSALFRVSAHEFGHCLGLGHAWHQGVEYSPSFDLMGGGRGWACPSNLDVLALERAFGYSYGMPFGGSVFVAPDQYVQTPEC